MPWCAGKPCCVLPELSGKVSIHSSYGNVNAKALSSAGNVFELSYSNAVFTELKSAKLSSEYGNVSIGTVTDLTGKFEYGGLKIV